MTDWSIGRLSPGRSGEVILKLIRRFERRTNTPPRLLDAALFNSSVKSCLAVSALR